MSMARIKTPQPPFGKGGNDVIAISTLTKYYNKSNSIFKRMFKRKANKLLALEDINLNLKKGRIVGLLGLNGAGKSTLMKCVLSFLKYTGEIKINDELITHLDHSIFHHAAFIPDVSGLDDRLTVEQTIKYVRGIHPKWNQERAEKLIEISKLPMNSIVKNLSKDMKTKLYLLITLAIDVDV